MSFAMPFGPDLPHDQLRAMAARRINIGVLPAVVPKELAAGYGSGEPCAVCGQPIERRQTVYEVSCGAYLHALALHVVCYSVWQLECARRLSREESSAGTDD